MTRGFTVERPCHRGLHGVTGRRDPRGGRIEIRGDTTNQKQQHTTPKQGSRHETTETRYLTVTVTVSGLRSSAA
jgi:hypothetical protein